MAISIPTQAKKNLFCRTHLTRVEADGRTLRSRVSFFKKSATLGCDAAVHKMPTMASFHISHTQKDVFSINESIHHQSAVRGGADGGVNRQAD